MIGAMNMPTDDADEPAKDLSMVDEALVAGTIANTNGLLVILAKLVAKGVFDRADLQSFSDSYSKPLDHVGMRENELVTQMQDQMESTLAELMRFLSAGASRTNSGLTVERCEDRAGAGAARAAFAREAIERIPRPLQLGDLVIERCNPQLCQRVRARSIGSRIELEQLLDLAQRETGRLRLANEAQAAQILTAITANSSGALRRLEKPLALIETDRFDPDASARRQFSDRQGRLALTLYHGTEPI